MKLPPRVRAALAGKMFTTLTGLMFLLCVMASGPLILGMFVGLFWRGFRLVNGW